MGEKKIKTLSIPEGSAELYKDAVLKLPLEYNNLQSAGLVFTANGVPMAVTFKGGAEKYLEVCREAKVIPGIVARFTFKDGQLSHDFSEWESGVYIPRELQQGVHKQIMNGGKIHEIHIDTEGKPDSSLQQALRTFVNRASEANYSIAASGFHWNGLYLRMADKNPSFGGETLGLNTGQNQKGIELVVQECAELGTYLKLEEWINELAKKYGMHVAVKKH